MRFGGFLYALWVLPLAASTVVGTVNVGPTRNTVVDFQSVANFRANFTYSLGLDAGCSGAPCQYWGPMFFPGGSDVSLFANFPNFSLDSTSATGSGIVSGVVYPSLVFLVPTPFISTAWSGISSDFTAAAGTFTLPYTMTAGHIQAAVPPFDPTSVNLVLNDSLSASGTVTFTLGFSFIDPRTDTPIFALRGPMSISLFVPEPSSLTLILSAILLLAGTKRDAVGRP